MVVLKMSSSAIITCCSSAGPRPAACSFSPARASPCTDASASADKRAPAAAAAARRLCRTALRRAGAASWASPSCRQRWQRPERNSSPLRPTRGGVLEVSVDGGRSAGEETSNTVCPHPPPLTAARVVQQHHRRELLTLLPPAPPCQAGQPRGRCRGRRTCCPSGQSHAAGLPAASRPFP
jgi:hypothetical protein